MKKQAKQTNTGEPMKKYPVGTKLKPKYDNGCTYEIRKRKGTWGFFVLSGNQKGEFHGWPDEDMFFSQVKSGFTVVRLGKSTPKQQIGYLVAELAAKDAEIDKIMKGCEDRVKQANEYRDSDSRSFRENMTRMTTDRDAHRDRANNAERRAESLSGSVTALKLALKSASESLCHSANAVKA